MDSCVVVIEPKLLGLIGIITDSDVQVPNTVHQLSPNILFLANQISGEDRIAGVAAVLSETASIVSPGKEQFE